MYNHYGLFSTKEWKPYDVIGEYTGKVIDYYKHSDYIIALSNISSSICVDADEMGNECRFINHYKNIADNPNCQYSMTFIHNKPTALVVVIRTISIGEEILVDYGYDL